MRSREEIDEQLNRIEDPLGPGKWPGMSYESGVEAALLWVTGVSNDEPMPDE